TSINFPEVSPVCTSTQSAFPLWIRTTNVFSLVRATDEVGTNNVGRGRRTGQSTCGYIPGASRPDAFETSSSTGIVRVFTSRESATRAILPANFSPGNAATVKETLAPLIVSGT